MSRRSVGAVLLGTMVIALAIQTGVGAYSRGGQRQEDDGGGIVAKCSTPVYYRFAYDPDQNDQPWTADLKDTVAAAFDPWEGPTDVGGGQVVNLIRSDSGDVSPLVKVRRRNVIDGKDTILGQATGCFNGQGTILLKASIAGEELRYTATHEMGHMLGLAHTGRNDSPMDDEWPTMLAGPCHFRNQMGTLEELSVDDRQAVSQRYGSLETMVMNPSFEQPLGESWTTSDANTSMESAAQEAYGQQVLRITPSNSLSSNYPKLYQSAYIYKAGEHDAAVMLRKESSGFGLAFLKLWRRPFKGTPSEDPYPTGAPGFCDVVPDGDFVFEKENSIDVTQSWAHYYTTDANPGRDRLVIQVVLRNELRDSVGGDTYIEPIRTDVLRVRTR